MAEYWTDSPADKRTRYQTMAEAMKADRSTFLDHWRELGDYLVPRRTRFWVSDRNKGDKRTQKILDSTGRYAVRTLQSLLHAGLTSPARPWMRLTTPDPDLAKNPAVKAWLSVVTQRMLTVFQQSNLYKSLPTVYADLAVFGTACMSVLEDTSDLFRCYPYPIGSYCLALDARGMTTAFMREYQLSVRQVIETFALKPDQRTIDWTKVSLRVKNAWDKSLYEEPIDLTWLVCPNPFADSRRYQAKFKPWTSCHWETGSSDPPFLRESGYNTFPILAPRWDVTGEDTYGTDCPGMTALPDLKQLMGQQKTKALAIQTLVKPPVIAPAFLKTQGTSLLPGGITYADDVTTSGRGMRSVYDIRVDVDHLLQDIQATQSMIERAFYKDLAVMFGASENGKQPRTAEEIRALRDEQPLGIGPLLERMDDDLLEPLIDRVYHLMEAARLIPAPPEPLVGVKIKAQYTSIMATAQKQIGIVALDRLMGAVTGLATVFPGVTHKIDTNRVIDLYADALGNDPTILRTDEQADQLAQQQAEAQQKAAEADQAAKMAGAMKDAGTTPMSGDTALTRMAAGQQDRPTQLGGAASVFGVGGQAA